MAALRGTGGWRLCSGVPPAGLDHAGGLGPGEAHSAMSFDLWAAWPRPAFCPLAPLLSLGCLPFPRKWRCCHPGKAGISAGAPGRRQPVFRVRAR